MEKKNYVRKHIDISVIYNNNLQSKFVIKS